MARTLTYTEVLEVEVCWCGINHAIPANLARMARESGQAVYCPLGHQWVVTETEIDKLRKREATLTARLDQERARAETIERSRNALKGELTKARKRAANGVCPCCKRSFVDVARHVRSKHPGFAADPEPTPQEP